MTGATRLRVLHPHGRARRGVLVVVCADHDLPPAHAVVDASTAALPGSHALVVRRGRGSSTQPSWQPLARFGARSILEVPHGLPISAAYREGFTWGLAQGYEAICVMEPDGSHQPSDLPRLVAPVLDGTAELTIGSRFVLGSAFRAAPRATVLRTRWANAWANAALGLGVVDPTSGFRAYAASLLERLPLSSLGADAAGHHVEMTHLARVAGACVVEIPVEVSARRDARPGTPRAVGAETFVRIAVLSLGRLRVRERGPARTTPGALVSVDGPEGEEAEPGRRA